MRKGSGFSIRGIANDLGIARNTVRRYLRTPEAVRPKPRAPRGSKLDPYMEYIDRRMGEGLENCVVMQRELRALGYEGSYTILADYMRPRRRSRQPRATVRFDTGPGEQAQIDWGSFAYVGNDGRQRRLWAFVIVLSWSRTIYVEFVSSLACLIPRFVQNPNIDSGAISGGQVKMLGPLASSPPRLRLMSK